MREKISFCTPQFIKKFFDLPYSVIFILLSVVMAGFSYIVLWFNSFYYGKPVSEIISFKVSDSWCPSPRSGFGLHCFGDYYSPVLALDMKNPWESGYAYTPISTLLFRPFHLIANIFDNPRYGLIFYLILGAFALSSAAFWSVKGSGFERSYLILLFGVLATPWIQAFDRGNSIMFLTPLMLGFAVSFIREKWFQTTCFVVAAVILKPQFLFLFLPFLAFRKWREILVGLSAITSFNILGFLLFSDHPIRTFNLWLSFNSKYDSGLLDNRLSSANVSFRQCLLDITTIIDRELFEALPGDGRYLLSHFVYDHSQQIMYLILLVLVIAVFFSAESSSKFHLVVISLVCSSLVIGTSWMYYQVFAIVIAALILRNPEDPVVSPRRGILDYKTSSNLDKFIKILIIIATLNSCFNLPIDSDVLPFDYVQPSSSISRLFVGPMWLLVLLAVLAKFCNSIFMREYRLRSENPEPLLHRE